MKAKELAKLLMTDPEANVNIGFEEMVVYSELTSGTEDRIENINSVYKDVEGFIFANNSYLQSEKIWPPNKN